MFMQRIRCLRQEVSVVCMSIPPIIQVLQETPCAFGKHGIQPDHLDHVQIHPTSLYSRKKGRSFLISESARGDGGDFTE